MPSEPYRTPATKSDVAFLAADMAIGLRSVVLALMALKSGNKTNLDRHINEITKQADEMWKAFHELRGESVDDELPGKC